MKIWPRLLLLTTLLTACGKGPTHYIGGEKDINACDSRAERDYLVSDYDVNELNENFTKIQSGRQLLDEYIKTQGYEGSILTPVKSSDTFQALPSLYGDDVIVHINPTGNEFAYRVDTLTGAFVLCAVDGNNNGAIDEFIETSLSTIPVNP